MSTTPTKDELIEAAGMAMLAMQALYKTWPRPTPALLTGLLMVAATGFTQPGFRWAVPSRAAWLTLCGAAWDEMEKSVRAEEGPS